MHCIAVDRQLVKPTWNLWYNGYLWSCLKRARVFSPTENSLPWSFTRKAAATKSVTRFLIRLRLSRQSYNPRYVSWPVHLSAARLTAAVCTTSYEHCVFGNFCHCYNSQLTSQFYDILQQTARVCFHVAIAFEYFVRRNNKTRKICLRQNIVRLNILIVFLCDSLKK